MTGSSRDAITVSGVSKAYVRDLRRAQRRGVAAIVGELRGRRVAVGRDAFYALRDVSLTVEAGTAVGVLGPNGAGKSTLLQLVAGLTRPDEGTVEAVGRVATLLDPSAGFNPLLSGRENLDMAYTLSAGAPPTPSTIERIVEEVELGRFIDAPLRTFSQGMRLRLGFAVALHCEADILVIDEALAVGDTAFQLYCLDTLRRFVSEGRTILFVTHSISLFQALATHGIFLDEGRIEAEGPPTTIADVYLAAVTTERGQTEPGQTEAANDAANDAATTGEGAVAGSTSQYGSGGAHVDGDPKRSSKAGTDGAAQLVDGIEHRPVVIERVSIERVGAEAVTAVGFAADSDPHPRSGEPWRLTVTIRAREAVPSAFWAFELRTADLTVGVVGSISRAGDVDPDEFGLAEGDRRTLYFESDRFPLTPGLYAARISVFSSSTREVLALHGYEDAPTFFDVVSPTVATGIVATGTVATGTVATGTVVRDSAGVDRAAAPDRLSSIGPRPRPLRHVDAAWSTSPE